MLPRVIAYLHEYRKTFILALLHQTVCYCAKFRTIPLEIYVKFLGKSSNINEQYNNWLTYHLWTFAFLESISMAAFAWSKALYVRDCLPFGLPLPPSIWAMNVDAFARRHNKSAFLAFCNGQFDGISHVQQLAEGPRYNCSKFTSDFLDF